MPIETIADRNMTGIDSPIIYLNDISQGLFVNMMLFMIWASVTFGIFFAQKRANGQGDFPMALATGGFITAVATILLGLIPGMVNVYVYALVLVIAMLSVLFFLLSKREQF